MRRIRSIQRNPYKILDAPGLEDDFYLNLLDWGASNLIAIGLENVVYTWNASDNKAVKLYEVDAPEMICSVSWNAEGKWLAVGDNVGCVKIFDIEREKLIRGMKNHEARCASLAWNGYLIGSGSRDRTIA